MEALEPLVAERFRPITGRGVRADIEGRTYFVGRPDLLGAHAAEPALTAAVAKLEEQGKTVVVVGTVDEPLGVIAVTDPVRAGAGEALQALRAQGVEHIVMLTGDNEPTAQAIGRQVGVDEVRAGLLPEDKVDAVRDLGEHYGPTAMVGDGVNDAPALAAAGLGIAMGNAQPMCSWGPTVSCVLQPALGVTLAKLAALLQIECVKVC